MDGVTDKPSAAFTPDPDMTPNELDTLRVMNGEDAPGWVGGAAANVCASWLKSRGYAEGHYSITQKGRDYLAALARSESKCGGRGMTEDEAKKRACCGPLMLGGALTDRKPMKCIASACMAWRWKTHAMADGGYCGLAGAL